MSEERGKIIRLYPGVKAATSEQTERMRRHGGNVKTWRCDVCGKVGTWGPSWSWHGSLKDLEDCPDASTIRVACSLGCRQRSGLPGEVIDG